jgi:WD40 repeat protein/tRNA A-37 threonylcarbamoyl transferase component Bud32
MSASQGWEDPGATTDVLEWVDEMADRFESAWKQGGRPAMADFLKQAEAAKRPALLRELIAIDLEYRWQTGERRKIEEYLDEFPELLGTDGMFPDALVLHVSRLGEKYENAQASVREQASRATVPMPRLRCPQCGNSVVGLTPSVHEASCANCGNSFRIEPDSSFVLAAADLPRTLGKFQLIELLGSGSFGAVYKARDTELGRFVAVKVPRSGSLGTAEEQQRFLREAQSAAQLKHPRIVQVHDIVYEKGTAYLVSDYIEGRTLAQLLTERRPGYKEAAELLASVADALDYAHGHKIIHRDITTKNILIDGAGRPFITDFGLARRDEGSIAVTLDGQVLGTPAYMSPEQAAGESGRVDARSDVYSLGVILYEMLTGMLPFSGSIRMVLHQVIHDEPQPPRKLNDRVPRDLETICLKALAKAPSRRYASAGALAADLRRYLKGEPIQARPAGNAERLWRWCRRNPVVAAQGLLVVVLLLAITGVAAFLVATAGDAERERKLAQERLYISDMRLARPYWEAGKGHWVLDLLKRHEPEVHDREAFEWYYWDRLYHSAQHILGPHRGGAHWVAFSPDGGRLASTGNENTVRIWDAASGTIIRTLAGHVERLAFSPDGQYLASASAGSVKVWHVTSGRQVQIVPGPDRHAADTHGAGLAFSPDGHLLAAGSGSTVKVWDVDWHARGHWKVKHTLRGHRARVANVAFSPDGLRLASGSGDKTLRIWDVRTGAEVRTLRHPHHVTAVAFSGDGQWLASGCDDSRVRIWNPVSGEEIRTLTGHGDLVRSVIFSRDSKRVASAGFDQTIRIWDAASGRSLRILQGHAGRVDSVAFSPNGSHLASASADETVRIWDAASCREARELAGHTKEVYGVAFSPDGSYLASASEDTTVKIWHSGTGQLRHTLTGHGDGVNGVSFSPDGKYLASASDDKTIKLWEAAGGKLVHTFTGHGDKAWCSRFDPEGRRLASCSEDMTVQIWELFTHRQVRTIRCAQQCAGIAFSPDGQWLAMAGWEPVLTIYDAGTGRELRRLKGHGESNWAVAFSPDGARLASASNDGTIKVWNAATGENLLTLRGHTGKVSSVAFTSDGKRLASGGWDGTARVCDAASGAEVLVLQGEAQRVFAVAFSPDNKQLAGGCADGKVRLWEATRRDSR